MKKRLLVILLCVSSFHYAQVGINTTNPQGVFHIDGSKDNPTTGVPSVVQQSNDFSVIGSSGLGTGTITVGIGTTAPTQSLDIANGNLRIRNINNSVGISSDKLLVADPNGIIKVAGGDSFSASDSGNRMLNAVGGIDMNAANDWNDNEFTTLKLDESYDPQNAYDPTTGVYTVPKDGLYFLYGVCGFTTPGSGSGTFDGTSGDAFTALYVDTGRVATTNTVIHRGNKNPSVTMPPNSNLYFLTSNATIWLKVGQKVSLQFLTYGTNNMVGNLSDLKISRISSRLIINKLL
ncbi:hypothetical protein A0O34_12125 [Chryseobacterium glaciei]|uniref:C1q domain-containing protein n=1 Tax=Chryseobacterium glaciei TaxID=1685010 RepID=A0A172XWG6_9FLAO|nr:hypothetical protein [Chryseobacterium glaciei]ANF51210.1 hypothetical protein A0O34_12125 [Chryseobacterium glaciei]